MPAERFDDTTLLIGLGAPRTGTKWMFQYFQEHPDILTSPIRLLHFFDDKHDNGKNVDFQGIFEQAYVAAGSGAIREALGERIAMRGDARAYIDHFRRRWAGEGAFADITPGYGTLGDEAFAEMARVHARVRFLFVMRNPVDLAWSTVKIHSRDPSPTALEAELQGLLNEERWRAAAGRAYLPTLDSLQRHAGDSQTLVLFYEELFAPRAIADLCDFAGADTHPAPIGRPVNDSAPAPLIGTLRERVFACFADVYRGVEERIGRLPSLWEQDMRSFG